MFEQIWSGTVVAFQWQNLLIALFGAGCGIVIGGLPGLSATMGVALLIPVTFGMHPVFIDLGCQFEQALIDEYRQAHGEFTGQLLTVAGMQVRRTGTVPTGCCRAFGVVG